MSFEADKKAFLDNLQKGRTIVKKKESGVVRAGKKVLGGAFKILDLVERPYYGLMETARDILGGEKGFHPVRSFVRGFTGKRRTSFGDVLTEAGWTPDTVVGRVSKGVVSFVGGVVLDPITFVTGGLGRGSIILGRGLKPLSKYGARVFYKEVAKKTGIKLGAKNFTKAMNNLGIEEMDDIIKNVIKVADSDPVRYYASRSVRLGGKKLFDYSDVSNLTRKILKPILDLPAVKIAGRFVKEKGINTIGDVFQPYYSILTSKKLSQFEKYKLIQQLENRRIVSEIERAEKIKGVYNLFKGMTKEQRKQVTYELEKFLPKKIIVKGKERFVASGYSLGKIKDKKVREVVAEVKDDVLDMINKEIKAGVRDPKSIITEGYVFRYLKGFKDKGSFAWRGRKKGGKTVEEAWRAFKAGEQSWYFETDASKWLLQRSTQHDGVMLNKSVVDYLKRNKFLTPIGRKGVKDGFVKVGFAGKSYQTIPELAKEFKFLQNTGFETREGWKQLLKFYDDALNIWKTSVTSLFPSFHSRNAYSNLSLAYLGGARNPKLLKVATRVQWYGIKKNKGMKVADEIIKLGDSEYKLSELYELGVQYGILGSGYYGADVISKMRFGPKNIKEALKAPWSPLNMGVEKMRRFGTHVENNGRMFLFLDQLAKGRHAQAATLHTKKFLFDYGELTDIERQYFKRIMPFYTWLRKNIPLQLEQMVKQPGKYTGILHGQEGALQMTPELEQKYLPDWLKEEVYFPYPKGEKRISLFRPDLPFQDLATMLNLNRALSSATPALRSLFEYSLNKDIFTGKPLAPEDLPEDKLKREKLKKVIMNNIRASWEWKRISSDEKTFFEKFLDSVLGIRSYVFDELKGKRTYYQKKSRERAALRKLERMK